MHWWTPLSSVTLWPLGGAMTQHPWYQDRSEGESREGSVARKVPSAVFPSLELAPLDHAIGNPAGLLGNQHSGVAIQF